MKTSGKSKTHKTKTSANRKKTPANGTISTAKKGQRAERRVQSGERRVQSASATSATAQRRVQSEECRDQIASLEKQLAAIEEQIAELEEQSAELSVERSAESRDQSAERRVENENISALCTLRSALPTPVLGLVLANSNAIVVTWEPVANSQQVLAVYSKDPDFENYGIIGVSGSMNSATLTGLQPNTLYYIRIKATGTGTYTDSEFSSVKTVTTQRDATSEAGDDPVSQLQNWLVEQQSLFQNVAALVPQLENTELNSRDRMRLNGSGVRRYGFIEKTADVSGEFPQFWPAMVGDTEKLNELVREIEVLRNLLVWFRFASRIVQDLLLIAGDDAFRLAGAYYAAARDWARRRNPEAQQVFQMLQLFWHRRRNPTEPTEKEVIRDVRGLMRGTKDGSVLIENESDTVAKGKKVVIDNTQKAQRAKCQCHQRSSK